MNKVYYLLYFRQRIEINPESWRQKTVSAVESKELVIINVPPNYLTFACLILSRGSKLQLTKQVANGQ